MDQIGKIFASSNGVPIAIICVTAIIIFLLLGKFGLFSFQGKGLSIGKTEDELRAVLLKQKEFLLQYCSYLTQLIISDMGKINIQVSYINTNYVVEKIVDQWLGWLLVNHISEDDAYVRLKVQQAKLTMFKAIGKVNKELLQNDDLKNYFEVICEKSTKEIIKGLLAVYKLDSKK